MTKYRPIHEANAPNGFRFTNEIHDVIPGMDIKYWNIGRMSEEIRVLGVDYENRILHCMEFAEFDIYFDKRVIYVPQKF